MNRGGYIDEFKSIWDKMRSLECSDYEDDCFICPLGYNEGNSCAYSATKAILVGLIKKYNKK